MNIKAVNFSSKCIKDNVQDNSHSPSFGSLRKNGKLDSFKSKEGWEKVSACAYDKKTNFWVRDLLDFVATWCSKMEQELEKGLDVKSAARKTFKEADESGITESGVGVKSAKSLIEDYWEYGDNFCEIAKKI